METDLVKVEPREAGGRSQNNRLRRDGLIPAVLYAHGDAAETLALSEHDFDLALKHQRRVITIKWKGQDQPVLIKEVQFDVYQNKPLHVDLMLADLTERVQTHVPLSLRGDALGVKEGGVLLAVLNELEIECAMGAIPGEIEVDVESLGLGKSLHVRDLTLPEGVTAVTPEDDTVVTVKAKRGTTAEELEEAEGEAAEEEGAEPEVIGRGKGEEDAEA